ncbi:MAG: biopolymer transporter ExbD [Bacteroidales bacterium]|nr:biopolymer transporter ExbD [Bacteroidales bacterium]
MGEIIVEEKGKKSSKHKPKKHSTRIDMTPMVDLMCLLITFFMLTTAFSKAKVMVITMPEKTDEIDPDRPEIPKNRTLNILLTGEHKVYYYIGIADPKKPTEIPQLVLTDFSKDGIRKVLLIKNRDLFTKIAEFRDNRITGKLVVADTTAESEIKRLKKDDKKGPIVLIKADDKVKYKDMVDIIDEMAICNIASYAVVDPTPTELEMLMNAPK